LGQQQPADLNDRLRELVRRVPLPSLRPSAPHSGEPS
jgi:hypothetical protein